MIGAAMNCSMEKSDPITPPNSTELNWKKSGANSGIRAEGI